MRQKKFKNDDINCLDTVKNYDPIIDLLIQKLINLCQEIKQINLFNDNYMKDFLIFLPIYSANPHTNLTPQ
ncbi:hypothetical protein ACOES3_02220, partial [Candidatus Phytoplasma citri]